MCLSLDWYTEFVDERVSALDKFVKIHFLNIPPSCVNLFADKTGQTSMDGFVELCSPEQVRMFTEGKRTRNLILDGHVLVKINLR